MYILDELCFTLENGASNGNRPKSSDYPPAQAGDVVLGIITDPGVLALMASYDSKLASALQRWPTPPTDVSEMAASIEVGMELDILARLVKYKIRHMFGMGPKDPVVVRQGWITVKEGDAPVQGVEVAAKKTVAVVKAVNEVDEAYTRLQKSIERLYGGADCGDESCGMCGYETRLTQANRAAARMIDAEEALAALAEQQ